MTLLISAIFGASQAVNLMQYSQMFTLTFTRAPLDVDRIPFENQLQEAWRNYKNVKNYGEFVKNNPF